MNDAVRQTKLYAEIWSEDPTYGTATHDVERTVEYRIGPHMERIFGHGIRDIHVVDFGAGDGRFLRHLRLTGYAWQCTGVDVYKPDSLPFFTQWMQSAMWDADIRSDYVISTDALEHLPPAKVPATLANIARTAPHGFLRISLKEDRYGTDRGLHLHESVFPAHEWLRLLREVGIEPTSYHIYFDTGRVEAAIEVYF